MIAAPYRSTAPETSRDAAASLDEATLGRLEKTVLDVIRRSGGATCDEIEVTTSLSHQTASARVNGLAKAGFIHDSNVRRPTRSGRGAVVWMATEVQQELFR